VTGVQRLFEKGYTPSFPLVPLGWRGASRVRVHARGAATASILAVTLTGIFLVAGLGAGASPSRGSSGGFHLATQPYAHTDTGRINVVFPLPLPRVELFQDANASVGASLQVDQILEVRPDGLPHPAVVAIASSQAVAGFNGTRANSTGGISPLSLSATLAVYPVAGNLWNGTPSVVLAPSGPSRAATALSISFTLSAPGAKSQGMQVRWSVVNWPWANTSDLLALEMTLTAFPANPLHACRAASPVSIDAPCVGSSVPAGTILWSPGLTSVEAEGPSGPTAAVTWNATASVGPGRAAPVTVGLYAPSNGSGQVVIGVAGRGASNLSGATSFALVAPLPVALHLPLVKGVPLAYGAALAVSAAAVLGGVVAYRRYEERLRRDL
jgi:hypothetical protein